VERGRGQCGGQRVERSELLIVCGGRLDYMLGRVCWDVHTDIINEQLGETHTHTLIHTITH